MEKILSPTQLNDNNICQIESNAFKDFNSLRSLSLNNNRLMKIPRSSFDDITINALSVAGNPVLTLLRLSIPSNCDGYISGNPFKCDCDTLWLRNLATDGHGVVSDVPTCQWPSSLAGNELRKLRTSRFTCAGSADGRRDSRKRDNACSAVPTKSPSQQIVKDQLNRGNLKDPNI